MEMYRRRSFFLVEQSLVLWYNVLWVTAFFYGQFYPEYDYGANR